MAAMQQRRIVAGFFVALAFTILLVRYLPPRVALHEIGDPLDQQVVSGFRAAEPIDGAIGRRTAGTASIRVPLADGRGAARLALQLRSGAASATRAVLGMGATTIIFDVPPTLRTLHLVAPPQAARRFDLQLRAAPGAAPLDLLLDRVSVWGRDGAPSLPDLARLLLIALAPGLCVALAAHLSRDWAWLVGALALGLLLLLPAADRPALLLFGPFFTAAVALTLLLPISRHHPAITLVTLGGALLRCYALGWGNGYVFHADEQMFAQATGGLSSVARSLAALALRFSGLPIWSAAGGMVLIGRALSMLLGTALIVAVYVLARALLRPRWALMAAAFTAVAPLLVQQSHAATSGQWDALVIVLVLLGCTKNVQCSQPRPVAFTTGATLLMVLTVAQPLPWLVAPAITLIGVQRSRRLPAWGALAMVGLLLFVGLRSLIGSLPAPAAIALASTPDETLFQQRAPLPAYMYTLFNLLAWGMGPLLMQLGLVGWGIGVLQCRPVAAASARYGRSADRAWLPLLIAPAAAFLIVGRDPARNVRGLVTLTPLLCLLAALLLQTFSLRLFFQFGRRVVRILANTALLLALVVSIGLLNVYREPDARIAVSRWFVYNALPGQQVLRDPSVRERLPLDLTQVWPTVMLPTTNGAPTPADRQRLATLLQQTNYLLLAVERADLDLARLQQRDPLTACYYRALFDARLGFMPRARFVPMPFIGPWSFDDRRTDAALRVNDHPRFYIWERYSYPTPQALDLALNCAAAQP